MSGVYERELILSDNEYFKTKTTKNQIVLHHTGGSSDPVINVQWWEKDPPRVAAHNVIGGISLRGKTEWDGKVVKALDSNFFAYHLGLAAADDNTRKPRGFYDMKSVAIEVCNYGQLTKRRDGKFYHYLNGVVPEVYVCDLGRPFRGFQYFQNYTDKQIEAVASMVGHHCKYENITLEKGRIFTWEDFTHDVKRFGNKSVAFHVNYRPSGKWDMYPHPKLIAMLNDLHSNQF